jgi:predicted DsbA family dithiol-disulfide isomerase
MRRVTIDVVSDAICPWCFVGKRRLEAAVRALPDITATVRWRPFFLDATLPASGVDKMSHYIEKFGRARIDAMIPMMASVGAAETPRIAFDYGGRIHPTAAAHAVAEAAFAAGGAPLQDSVVEALFKHYFEERGDLTAAEVARVAAGAGLAPAAASAAAVSGAAADAVRAEAREWRAKYRVTGVPFFVIREGAGGDDGAVTTLSGAQDARVIADAIRGVADA